MQPTQSSTIPHPSLQGSKFLVVEARFYDAIGAMLLKGAIEALETAGAQHDLISVPGALEIPAAMAIALDRAMARGHAYHGAIALGCVIRGETYHFEIVATQSARALMDMSVSRRLALGNAILTVENEEQALVRADPARGNKGGEAARAALTLALLKQSAGQ